MLDFGYNARLLQSKIPNYDKGGRKILKNFHMLVVTVSWWVFTGTAWAAGAAPVSKLINVADTRFMEPGVSKWIADLYNANLWLYGITVVVVMAVIGLVIGLSFDKLLAATGIDLGKLDHSE